MVQLSKQKGVEGGDNKGSSSQTRNQELRNSSLNFKKEVPILPITAATSQKLLYNLHATAESSGGGSGRNHSIAQNNRYRSEHQDSNAPQ